MTRSESPRRRTGAFGTVTITDITLRNRSAITPDVAPEKDDICLALVIDGAVRVVGGTSTLTSGTGLLLEGASLGEITAVGDGTLVVLTMPDRGNVRNDVAGRLLPITGDAPLMKLVTALVANILALDDELDWVSRHAVESMLTDVSRLLIAQVIRHRRSPRAPEVFGAAIAMIATHCVETDLTVVRVARHVRLSQRQLERAFQRRGTTISREIRRARVEHAVALLKDESRHGLTIDQIAGLVGFSNSSSLARAMQTEGCASPATVRDRARALLVSSA